MTGKNPPALTKMMIKFDNLKVLNKREREKEDLERYFSEESNNS